MSLIQMSVAVEPAAEEQAKSGKSGLARWTRPALGLLLPLVLALGWELVVRAGLGSGRLVPPPSRIYAEFDELARSGELLRHVIATLLRVVAGFGLGTLAGTLLGAVAGYSTLARRLIDPSLQGMRAVPSIAWIPLFILWLGIFETSKVALIAVGVFFPIYLGVMGAVMILLPAVLPSYVIALRSGLGLGWMFVIAAEFMGASEGLGYLLIDGQQLGKPAEIVAAILAFAVLGKTTDWIVALVTAPFLRWEDHFARSTEA
jgi:sulfonate transport system permease protein